MEFGLIGANIFDRTAIILDDFLTFMFSNN